MGLKREGREQRNNKREREREREPIMTCLIKSRRERIKYYYLSLELCYSAILKVELCYSAILKVELHCSTIAKKIAIVEF